MSLTVVTWRQARPGAEVALVEAAVRILGAPQRWQEGRRRVLVLQSRDAPGLVITISEWRSHEEWQAALGGEMATRPLEDYCTGPPRRGQFRQLGAYEILSRQALTACAALMKCPPERREWTLQFLTGEVFPDLREHAGFVAHRLYENTEDGRQLLALVTWESSEDREYGYHDLAPSLDAHLRSAGVWIEHFSLRTRAELAAPVPAPAEG